MMEQEKARSLFDVFAASQETFEEAKKKSNDESRKGASYFRLSQDGTYNIRILPLAPVMDKDGNFLELERKGYEYPIRSLMLKIEDPNKLVKSKPAITYVTICNAKYVFPDIPADLVDTYLKIACEKYADEEKLVKKLRGSSFEGGLKWDSRRCMYVIDLDKVSDGIQLLQLSYSQYKDLEERKLNLWGKLNKKGNVPCPISSIDQAYPVEITRKTENKKATYSFNIDAVSGVSPLEESTLQNLLDMPRIPEQVYRYSRYHLEATIAYLQQLDEKFDIDVMSDPAITECIDQIKTLLPADDQSHFTLGGKNDDKSDGTVTIDGLWDRYDALAEAGLDDHTEEGQELRADIKDFIQENQLDTKITRKMTNEDILKAVEEDLNGVGDEEDENPEEEASAKPTNRARVDVKKEDDDEDDDEPSAPQFNDEEDDEEPEPPRRGRERNDDTNEPAARSSRRSSRVARRRQ